MVPAFGPTIILVRCWNKGRPVLAGQTHLHGGTPPSSFLFLYGTSTLGHAWRVSRVSGPV